jgi:Trk K+ transport system NAD-binding subunit
MNGLLAAPVRNLLIGVVFVIVISFLATLAYMTQGWSLGDAFYMVVLTVFTVGYEEVRLIDTPALRAITIVLIVTGCTGMIFLTGALVQFFTLSQLQQILGVKRMNRQIDEMRDHVIVCGFGRVGAMLATELRAGRRQVLVVELSADRCAEAREQGFVCMQAEASDEAVLAHAGVLRARALASVVPSDAVNVFITLSARGLNPAIQIIARAELPATEKKLLQAGANAVVMPAHIGAEQVASLILFPALSSLVQFNDRRRQMEMDLRMLGLEFEVVVAAEGSSFAGLSVDEIERAADNHFMIVAVERAGTSMVERPDGSTRIRAGDGVTLLGRGGRAEAVRRFG